MDDGLDRAREEARIRGVGTYEKHIFLCVGPDCCTTEDGLKSWGQLKSGVARLNGSGEAGRIYRTKVGCLRICNQGPTAVVYPEGTWYGGMRDEALQRVIVEHLGGGTPVSDFIIGENPLTGD